MNKYFFSVLLLSSSVTAFAQTRSCDDQSLSDQARNTCYEQLSAGRGGQQQNLQRSANVRRCEELLARAAGTTPAPTPAAAPTPTPAPTTGATPTAPTAPVQPAVAAAPLANPISTLVAGPGPMIWNNLEGPAVAAPVAPAPPLPALQNIDGIRACRALQMTAAGARGGSFDATSRNVSMDQRVTCQKLAGYTADYSSCMNALNMYNNVKMAEAALFIVQGVQATQNQQSVQNETAQRVAAGDAQNAAYDAQISATRKASQLNQQKAAAYAAAVLALGSTIQGWIKESNLPQALCSGNPTQLGPDRIYNPQQFNPAGAALPNNVFATAQAVSAPPCQASVQLALSTAGDEVMANKQAKGQITAALMELIGKGIAAGIAANQLGNIAKKVEEAKNATEDPYNPATFDVCQVNLADPRCAQAGTRTGGSGLQDGGFSFGEGFGNNAFTPIGSEEDMTPTDPLALPGDQVVGDTTNPFVDDAKRASGILDPAGAASIQPGAAAGGGGGGGAGSPGGGSASLGNDTPGADDSKKENDIKANKADGKYGSFAGGGFQAIKPMKEDNPFANLFDGKGGGKLEEDRSIASGDIDGRDSGIFSKISKRYGQVQADKRIEAKNLEE